MGGGGAPRPGGPAAPSAPSRRPQRQGRRRDRTRGRARCRPCKDSGRRSGRRTRTARPPQPPPPALRLRARAPRGSERPQPTQDFSGRRQTASVGGESKGHRRGAARGGGAGRPGSPRRSPRITRGIFRNGADPERPDPKRLFWLPSWQASWRRPRGKRTSSLAALEPPRAAPGGLGGPRGGGPRDPEPETSRINPRAGRHPPAPPRPALWRSQERPL